MKNQIVRADAREFKLAVIATECGCAEEFLPHVESDKALQVLIKAIATQKSYQINSLMDAACVIARPTESEYFQNLLVCRSRLKAEVVAQALEDELTKALSESRQAFCEGYDPAPTEVVFNNILTRSVLSIIKYVPAVRQQIALLIIEFLLQNVPGLRQRWSA